MAITVGLIYDTFPQIKPEDIQRLVGTSNYNSKTVIPLDNIAKYSGQYASNISVFTAKREGGAYAKLLPDEKFKKVKSVLNNSAIQEHNKEQNVNQPQQGTIPLDKSVFDIANKKQNATGMANSASA